MHVPLAEIIDEDFGKALIDSGFGDLRRLGHLMARTTENQHFETSGVVNSTLRDEPSFAAPTFIRLEGKALLKANYTAAEIEIAAKLRVALPKVARGEKQGEQGYTYEDCGLGDHLDHTVG